MRGQCVEEVRNIIGVELVGQRAVVEGVRITGYRADVKIAFVVEEVT